MRVEGRGRRRARDRRAARRLEDALALAGGDARPIVAHADLDPAPHGPVVGRASARVAISIAPPARVNFTALPTRFVSTCSTRADRSAPRPLGIEREREAQPALGEQRLEHRRHRLDQRRERRAAELEHLAAVRGARAASSVGEERVEPLAALRGSPRGTCAAASLSGPTPSPSSSRW
jgi:hypothetical protein